MTSAEFEAFMNQMDSLSARLDKQRAKFEKEKVQIDEKIAEKRKNLKISGVKVNVGALGKYCSSVSTWGKPVRKTSLLALTSLRKRVKYVVTSRRI